jgi:hypothetical protein
MAGFYEERAAPISAQRGDLHMKITTKKVQEGLLNFRRLGLIDADGNFNWAAVRLLYVRLKDNGLCEFGMQRKTASEILSATFPDIEMKWICVILLKLAPDNWYISAKESQGNISTLVISDSGVRAGDTEECDPMLSAVCKEMFGHQTD